MSKAFDKIAAGLADAISYAEGDTTRGRVAAGPACPGEGRGQGDPRQDPAQPGRVADGPQAHLSRQAARPRRKGAVRSS